MTRIIVCLIMLLISCTGTTTTTPVTDADVIRPASPEQLARELLLDTAEAVEIRVTKLDSILNSLAADSASFTYLAALLTKTLSNPNSPFRNEALYSTLLDRQLRSHWYIPDEKLVFENRLKLIEQNKVGSQANDFTFYTPDNKERKLYDVKAERLLLLFYNPECNACKETKAEINRSGAISSALQNGTLGLLAIYPDPDIALWKRHLHENPTNWINGRDENEYIWNNRIYDLRAIPTMYLLDENKKVLLKDASVWQIGNTLTK